MGPADLPLRGAAVRELDLPLPPGRMPLLRGDRPLKRWRWVGVFSPELMLCVAAARIGPLRRRWWAIAWPDGRLVEGTRGISLGPGRVAVHDRDVRIELELEEHGGVEVASPHGGQYVWTRKQASVPARGRVAVAGESERLDCEAFVDDSAGYHARRTSWRWSAGVGRSKDGRAVGWNLVDGVHDLPKASERTVWVAGEPREVGPVDFAEDLSRVGGLRFTPWCEREERMNLLLVSNSYRQPFGTFAGALPDGPELAEGLGVMEHHVVRW